MLVIDASVLANLVGDDGVDGATARTAVRGRTDLAVPDLAYVETVAVLRKRWIARTMTDDRLSEAVADLTALPMRQFPTRPLMRRAVELRATVTVYDAAYVALAEALQCDLITADARLARANGPRCTIRVVT